MPDKYASGRPFDFARAVFNLQSRIQALETNRDGLAGAADGAIITDPILQTTPAGDPSSGQLIYAQQVDPLNTNGDFEEANGVEPWGGLNGAGVALTAIAVNHGSAALIMNPDGISANPQAVSEQFAATGSTQYSASMWLNSPQGWATTQMGFNWYDSVGQPISQSLVSPFSLAAGVGQMRVVTTTSPSNAAYGQLTAQLTGTPSASIHLCVDTAWAVLGSTPAALTLASSITGAAGTDQYGASFPTGASLSVGNILGSILASGSVDATKVSFRAGDIGGTTVSVQATAPTGATANDLWFDTSADNALFQYNGAAWVPYQYGTQAIAAGSITAALIAANTIIAANIAAGTILGSNIAAGTLTADLIQAGAITAGLIAAGAIDGLVINGVTINGNTVSAADVLISGADGGLFLYGSGGTTVKTFTASGTWTCPANVASILCECVASGGGSAGGSSSVNQAGPSGGAGEYAAEPTLAVTPGHVYTFTINAAGTAGAINGDGGNGGDVIFPGDSATVTAHGGGGGKLSTSQGGTAGSGYAGTVSNPGGVGANTAIGFTLPTATGPGGASSGGTTETGRNGTGGGYGSGTNGNGASAVSGGGNGGKGGNVGSAGSTPTTAPGGGGGGGSFNHAGAAGKKGQIRITYTPSVSNLIGSVAGQVGTDPVAGTTVPEGASFDNLAVGKQLTATGGTATNPTLITTDTWHSLGALTGFTVTKGRYKLSAVDNMLIVDIEVVNNTGANSVTFANTMPLAYRPPVDRHYTLELQGNVGSLTNQWPRLFIGANGTVQVLTPASSGQAHGGTFYVPLD